MATIKSALERNRRVAKAQLLELLGKRQGALLWDSEISEVWRLSAISGVEIVICRTNLTTGQIDYLEPGSTFVRR